MNSDLESHILNCLIQACLLLLKSAEFFILRSSGASKVLEMLIASLGFGGESLKRSDQIEYSLQDHACTFTSSSAVGRSLESMLKALCDLCYFLS